MKKIIVIGCPGSGKTTFAEKLRDKTGLPLFYLDAIWHKPDKTHISREEFDARLAEILELDSYIIDGNYSRSIETRMAACDTVFLFDLPTESCIDGAILRIGKERFDMPWVDTELDPRLKTEIEEFGIKNLPGIYELIDKYKNEKTVFVFKSRENADEFLTCNLEYYMNNTQFRFATEQDIALILEFIRALADYEKMSEQVIATEELLREWIFEKKKAEVIFAMENGIEVGFALFFHNFSTFLGRAGIYLEDLFVKPEYRGRGHGKALVRELARIAVDRECGRLEWCCLDWNKPSIDFYLSIGAQPLDEWTIYRLTGESLNSFAESK